MKTFKDFCDSVLGEIPRATGREKADIRDELLDHLMEHRDMLVDHGVEPLEAERRAIEAMGDPMEIGRAWNEKLSSFWLWLGRVCAVCCVLIVLYTLSHSEYRLRMIWNVWQVQHGQETVELDEVNGYDLVWEKDPGICEEFGEHMIRVPKVALWQAERYKDLFTLQVYVVTYPQDPLDYPLPMNLLLWKLDCNLFDNGGGGTEFHRQGYSEVRRSFEVKKGMESAILDMELYGNTFHAEIPLEWEGV